MDSHAPPGGTPERYNVSVKLDDDDDDDDPSHIMQVGPWGAGLGAGSGHS